jgi:hypothetical protein
MSGPTTPRLAHCTPVWGGHYSGCDRDGTYCSRSAHHDGACTPHGRPRPVCDHLPMPYDAPDGALGHGWACGLCGEVLQAG